MGMGGEGRGRGGGGEGGLGSGGDGGDGEVGIANEGGGEQVGEVGGSAAGSVAINDPIDLVVGFVVPVYLKGLFRRFCGVTSSVITKGFVKMGTLTTVKDANSLVFFIAN